MNAVQKYLAAIGKKGGKANTEAQNQARRKNGKLGGRPPKKSTRGGSMKTALAIVAFAMALVSSAFAQKPSNMRCYDGESYGRPYSRVCFFSDGMVNVHGRGGIDWYTAKEWNRAQAREAAERASHTNPNSEAEAQSWHRQEGCEADGFVWHDDGCHARATKSKK